MDYDPDYVFERSGFWVARYLDEEVGGLPDIETARRVWRAMRESYWAGVRDGGADF